MTKIISALIGVAVTLLVLFLFWVSGVEPERGSEAARALTLSLIFGAMGAAFHWIFIWDKP